MLPEAKLITQEIYRHTDGARLELGRTRHHSRQMSLKEPIELRVILRSLLEQEGWLKSGQALNTQLERQGERLELEIKADDEQPSSLYLTWRAPDLNPVLEQPEALLSGPPPLSLDPRTQLQGYAFSLFHYARPRRRYTELERLDLFLSFPSTEVADLQLKAEREMLLLKGFKISKKSDLLEGPGGLRVGNRSGSQPQERVIFFEYKRRRLKER